MNDSFKAFQFLWNAPTAGTILRHLVVVSAVALAISAAAPPLLAAAGRTNVIIFVADGLRGGSVNPTDAPAMDALQRRGVRFTNSHSLFPTVTTANASALATGHALGDTRDFGNSLFTGPPVRQGDRRGTAAPIVFIENDAVLRELDDEFGGNYLTEQTLLASARIHGYLTAAIGKQGPALIQDVTQNNTDGKTHPPPPQTIIIDDATGSPEGVPLAPDIAKGLVDKSLATKAPDRRNGYAASSQRANSYSGDSTRAGTLAANVVQQKYFADALTRVVLPMFAKSGQPFVIVFWSRDPDGTQHNQGDSLNTLRPGINGPTSKAAIRNCDANLAQILAALHDLQLETNTDVLVTADHGFDTISRHEVDAAGQATKSYSATLAYYDSAGRQEINPGYLPPGFLAIDLAHALGMPLYDAGTINQASQTCAPVDPAKGGPGKGSLQRPVEGDGLLGGTGRILPMTDAQVVVAVNGGSDLIYLPGEPDPKNPLVPRIVDFLTQQDYVSGIFVDDQYGDLPGALKLSDINLMGNDRPPKHLPTPAIVVNFASFATDLAHPTQSGVIVADGGLQEGQGNHGGFDRAATFNFMAACGPDFKRGYLDPAPVSNADIPVTAAKLLGFEFPAQGGLTGRVIAESLLDGPAVTPNSVQYGRRRSSIQNGVQTVLDWQEYRGHRYFHAAGFPGRTVGLGP